MKAIVITGNTLSWSEVAKPAPGAGEVLVKVRATAINRADLMQRRGLYPPPPGASPYPGLECAGEVVAVGPRCARYAVGDKVCALLAGGGYAEYATAHEGSVLPLPRGLSCRQAAALPEVFATAWLNLFMEAGLQPGEKVVIHAGASGVGTAAIQLCKSFGSPVFVTAGAEDKLSACLDLGANAGFNRHAGAFRESARTFAGEGGVDVILDPVGAGYFSDNLSVLGVGGRLVLIGLMSGARADIDLGHVMRQRIRIIGSTLRARPVTEKAGIMAQLEEQVWPKLASGEIRPIIEAELPLQQAAAAHDLVASNATIGKVILTVDG